MLRLTDEGKRERPGVRFRDMSIPELIKTGQRGVPESQALELLIAGFFKGLCDERDTARLKELLREREQARLEKQEAARFKAVFGRSRQELDLLMAEKGGGR